VNTISPSAFVKRNPIAGGNTAVDSIGKRYYRPILACHRLYPTSKSEAKIGLKRIGASRPQRG
jgi:hypothetical protein